MAEINTAEVYDTLDKINRHLRMVGVVATLMVIYGASEGCEDMLQEKEILDIGELIEHLADDAKAIAATLEAKLDELVHLLPA